MPLRLASLFLLAVGILTPAIFAGDSTVPATTISWSTDYAQASNAANDQGKMLLILFSKPDDPQTQRLESETFANAEVQRKMQGFICLRLPLDSKLTLDGKEIVLVQHPSFSEMLGRPGVAIVDYAHRDPKLHGYVVSTFPLTGGLFYSPAEMQVILDLPPGTLTQRTLIYAVRIHPEKPASALGQPDDRLLSEAENHSHHQARILLQGHHGWEARGPRIAAIFGGSPREVCAESWPGQNLVESAIECVRCWRLSSGHWGAVQARNRGFGYDMKLGANGIWYATGIFATD